MVFPRIDRAMSYLRFAFRRMQRISSEVALSRSEVVAETPWRLGAHNYLRDLLTNRKSWRRWPRPVHMRDIVVVRPRVRMFGWSCAPQTSRQGKTHIVRDMAYGTERGVRLGYVRWVCGGHSTFPVVGDPPEGSGTCDRCKRLDPWRDDI